MFHIIADPFRSTNEDDHVPMSSNPRTYPVIMPKLYKISLSMVFLVVVVANAVMGWVTWASWAGSLIVDSSLFLRMWGLVGALTLTSFYPLVHFLLMPRSIRRDGDHFEIQSLVRTKSRLPLAAVSRYIGISRYHWSEHRFALLSPINDRRRGAVGCNMPPRRLLIVCGAVGWNMPLVVLNSRGCCNHNYCLAMTDDDYLQFRKEFFPTRTVSARPRASVPVVVV